MKVGYHLSSEEFSAPDLVGLAKRAEGVGFEFAFISDHYLPWLDSQGESPFVWSTIGAISQATKRLKIVTAITCPIMRIHPAIIAQAAATAGQLMEGRFILGLGTGENLNEHIVGKGWPRISVRQKMLAEAVEIIRLLFDGKYHDYVGKYFTVEDARLYSLPRTRLPIFVAAAGPKSAALSGRVADGLISAAPVREVVEAFEAAGGRGKPKYALLTVCFDTDEERAKKTVRTYWPTGNLSGGLGSDLPTPKHFGALAASMRPEEMEKGVVVGGDKETHLKALQAYADAGFEHVAVHQVGPNQEDFFRFYQKEILSEFVKTYAVVAEHR